MIMPALEPAPNSMLLHNAILDICRRSKTGGIDSFQCILPRIRNFNAARVNEPENEKVHYEGIKAFGNELLFYGQVIGEPDTMVSDRFKLWYVRDSDVDAIWRVFPNDLRQEILSVIDENRSAPSPIWGDEKILRGVQKISYKLDEPIRSPYSWEFCGEAHWVRGFNFDKPVKLSSGEEVAGIRQIDFKDCTELGVVTAKGEHYALHDFIRGRDVIPFNDALRKEIAIHLERMEKHGPKRPRHNTWKR